MKIIFFLFAVMLFQNSTFCQSTDSSTRPPVLLTENEMRMKKILARMRNHNGAVGQSFGSFSVSSIDGPHMSSQDLKGKITIVNFWFDACPPCHLEFKNLNHLYTKYQSDSNFQMISFTFDGIDAARANARKYGLLYKIFSVSNELCHQLNFQNGFPINFIVDEFGNASLAFSGVGREGADILAETIIPKIDSLLSNLNKTVMSQ